MIQTETIPTQYSQTAEQLIRGLWYAWRLPELHRHEVIQERVTDPLVADVFAAVLAGDEARLEGTAGEDILDLVAAYEPPPGLLAMLKEKRKSLPADFFQKASEQQPIMVAPELADPGEGNWPQRRAHTCEHGKHSGAVVTLRGKMQTISKLTTPAWRESDYSAGCSGCQYDRAMRAARQILVENWRHGELRGKWLTDEKEYKRFTARMRDHRRRGKTADYAAFPMTDGRFFVVHSLEREGGAAISNNRQEVMQMIDPIVNDTPEDKRIAPSKGWGGNWRGMRGDGRAKEAKANGNAPDLAVQVWTKLDHHSIAAVLGCNVGDKKADNYQIAMSARDAFEKLAEAGVMVYCRESNQVSLDEFIQRHDVDVVMEKGGRLTIIPEEQRQNLTHNAHRKTQKSLCALCVRSNDQTGAAQTDTDGGGTSCECK